MEVLGVSYDSTEKNRDFAEAQRLPFALLSDVDRSLAKAVGAARKLLPVPRRVSYLVGSDGRVVKAYDNVRPKAHAAEVIEDFRALAVADQP